MEREVKVKIDVIREHHTWGQLPYVRIEEHDEKECFRVFVIYFNLEGDHLILTEETEGIFNIDDVRELKWDRKQLKEYIVNSIEADADSLSKLKIYIDDPSGEIEDSFLKLLLKALHYNLP